MEGLLAYFLGKQGVLGAILLPEVNIFKFCLSIQHFKGKSTGPYPHLAPFDSNLYEKRFFSQFHFSLDKITFV